VCIQCLVKSTLLVLVWVIDTRQSYEHSVWYE
jgi:hypothetical protein